MKSDLLLRGDLHAPRAARMALDEFVHDLDGRLLTDLRLVVTEMVTAMIHTGAGAPLSVRVEVLSPDHLRGEVEEDGGHEPRRPPARLGAHPRRADQPLGRGPSPAPHLVRDRGRRLAFGVLPCALPLPFPRLARESPCARFAAASLPQLRLGLLRLRSAQQRRPRRPQLLAPAAPALASGSAPLAAAPPRARTPPTSQPAGLVAHQARQSTGTHLVVQGHRVQGLAPAGRGGGCGPPRPPGADHLHRTADRRRSRHAPGSSHSPRHRVQPSCAPRRSPQAFRGSSRRLPSAADWSAAHAVRLGFLDASTAVAASASPSPFSSWPSRRGGRQSPRSLLS